MAAKWSLKPALPFLFCLHGGGSSG